MMNRYRLIAVLAVLSTSVCEIAAAEEDGVRKLTSAERTVVAKGAAWGTVTSLSDGSLGLMYQKARPIKECKGVNVALEWIRSTDGGKSWSRPVLVSERRGSGGKLYQKRPQGGYIAFQERNQAVGQLPSGRIVVSFCRLDYSYRTTGEQVTHAETDFGFENRGVFYCWSDDLGKTWSKAKAMDAGPVGGKAIASHWRIVSLADGTAMMSVYGANNPKYQGPVKVPAGTKKLVAVLRSTDNGETWGDPSIILSDTNDQFYEETTLCVVGKQILAHVRKPGGNIDQYVSTDDGRTWKKPTPLTEGGQHPGGAFLLKSGKLMATWGNRRLPMGAAAMLSSDEGKTWDYAHRVSLAWDAPNENCGYANGAQAGDGSIVVVYYIMHVLPDGPDGYHKLWQGSKVYAVRFTEQQFLKAAGL
jgi:hypothetical protein